MAKLGLKKKKKQKTLSTDKQEGNKERRGKGERGSEEERDIQSMKS